LFSHWKQTPGNSPELVNVIGVLTLSDPLHVPVLSAAGSSVETMMVNSLLHGSAKANSKLPFESTVALPPLAYELLVIHAISSSG
jgi:hypothetical protein